MTGLTGRIAALVLCAFLVPPVSALAAFELGRMDARAAGMAATFVDPFQLTVPSVSAHGDSSSATRSAMASSGEVFGLRETRWGSVGCAAPIGNAVFAFGATALGGDLYRERTLRVSVAGSCSEDTAIAVGVRGLSIGSNGIDDIWSLAVDAGACRTVLGRILFAARCENLTGSDIGGSPLGSRCGLGVAIELPDVELRLTLSNAGSGETAVTIGCETALTEWLRVRAGACEDPGKFAAGLGLGRVSSRPWPAVDVAWQWHPELGGSSFASITFSW